MVTAKTGTVQKFPKPRGRAPKNASGQPATWDPDRGEWTGVVKNEARRRAEAARTSSIGRDLGLRQGRVGRRHRPLQAQARKLRSRRSPRARRSPPPSPRRTRTTSFEAACPPRPCVIAVASTRPCVASTLCCALLGSTPLLRRDVAPMAWKSTRHAIDAPLRQHHDVITRRRGRAPPDSTGRAGRLGQRDGRLGRRRQRRSPTRAQAAARAGTARRGVELRDGRVGGRRQDVGQEEAGRAEYHWCKTPKNNTTSSSDSSSSSRRSPRFSLTKSSKTPRGVLHPGLAEGRP